ncbi:MAG TPA: hypothetical protein VI431_08200 [Candidatus Acidoferrum sp.]
MKSPCEKWKDALREAALTGASSPELAAHLQTCVHCSADLRELEARRQRLDVLLPQIAGGAEPSVDFRARVLAATESAGKNKRLARWQAWTLAGMAATGAIVLLVSSVWRRAAVGKIQPEELAAAQQLAEWHAPSDSLLATPGREILRTTPKLGKSYLRVPVKEAKEE